MKTARMVARIRTRVFVAALLLAAAVLAPGVALASQPCTDAEKRISASYYDNKGKFLASAPRGDRNPKFCPPGKPTNYREICTKPGASAAIDFLGNNIEAITTGSSLSGEVYAAASRIAEMQVGRQTPPADMPYDTVSIVPRGALLEARKRVTVPPSGTTTAWLHRESGLYFTLTRRPGFSAGSERDVVVIAFRGTEPLDASDWAANMNQSEALLPVAIFGGSAVPHMYLQAQEAAFQVVQQRIQQRCAFSIVYTGHSLGGGLAVHAAFMVGTSSISCQGRKDSLLTFNAALSGRDNLRELTRVQNDVGLYAIFHTTLDPLRRFGNFDVRDPVFFDEQASRLARRAQTVVFANVDVAGSSPLCPAQPYNPGCALDGHSISNLHESLVQFKLALGRSPVGVPPAQVQQACAWYEPIKR